MRERKTVSELGLWVSKMGKCTYEPLASAAFPVRRLTSLDKVWLLSHGQELLICPHWCRLTMKMPFHWTSASQACFWEECSEEELGLLPSPAPRHLWPVDSRRVGYVYRRRTQCAWQRTVIPGDSSSGNYQRPVESVACLSRLQQERSFGLLVFSRTPAMTQVQEWTVTFIQLNPQIV